MINYCNKIQQKLNEAKLANKKLIISLTTEEIFDLEECGFIIEEKQGGKYLIKE